MSSYDDASAGRGARDETDIDPTNEGRRGEWVSVRAVAWVLDDAPCPAELLPVLTAIARRCDENGKGSRQRTAVIAEKAGKSKKQAQRDIVRLRELKLLEQGDQGLVAHIPEHERPTVYDLPLHIKGPKPVKGSRNPTGLKKEAVNVGESDTPSLPRGDLPSKGGGPIQGMPPLPFQGRGDLPSKGAPPSLGRDPEEAFEEALEQPVQQPSLSGAGSERPSAPEQREHNKRERDDEEDFQQPEEQPHPLATPRRLLAEHCGITDTDLADQIAGYIESGHQVRHNGFWITAARNGTLTELAAEAVAAINYTATAPGAPAVDTHEFVPHPDFPAVECVHCRRHPNHATHRTNGWTPQSPADHAVTQAAALAAKLDRLDGTNATGTNTGWADEYFNLATNRLERGDPFNPTPVTPAGSPTATPTT